MMSVFMHCHLMQRNDYPTPEFTKMATETKENKRAQRALGRSPEEKVKGHSGANNREPQGHNLF